LLVTPSLVNVALTAMAVVGTVAMNGLASRCATVSYIAVLAVLLLACFSLMNQAFRFFDPFDAMRP
jgi:hypothetical protein